MIAWSNLWKCVQWVPGTLWARLALTGWQLGLMWAPVVGFWLWAWWGAVGGTLAAFLAHELLFSVYAPWVAQTPLADDGDLVGMFPSRADYTFERFLGPVR